MNPSSLIGHVLDLLDKVDHSKQPADRTAADFFRSKSYLGSHDRRYIADTVFGIIRHRRYVEALLEEFVDRHPQDAVLDSPPHRYLSVLAGFSVLAGCIGDPTAPVISIPDAVWKSKFPNVDLSSFLQWFNDHSSLDFLPPDNSTVCLGVRYSFQDWMIEEWKKSIGDELEPFLAACNTPAPTTLRVNLSKVSRDECRMRLAAEGIEARETQISASGLVVRKRFGSQALPAFRDGWFEVQDEGSQLVSLVGAPSPGSVVIDACAGAGGKTLHLADLMKNQGKLFAVDIEPKRLDELRRRASRAGATIIHPMLQNEIIPDRFRNQADLVVIDAPCTGSGTIRRNPGYKWSISAALPETYSRIQTDILEFNAPFVKEGGNLLYATCSLFERENQAVIYGFLSRHAEFMIEKDLPFQASKDGFLLFTPHKHQTDGFTIAKLKRIG